MKENKKILILTLNSGENEFKDSLNVLENQSYRNWQHKVFSFLPNKEAHNTLYSYIMDHALEYDLFIKLDADMILFSKDALRDIVTFFNTNPNVDQANFSVRDVMSGWEIMGLLVFTNKAKWNFNEERLFVDHTPSIPGKRLLVWGSPSPVASHCSNPHPFQAFHYGAHRAMKAIQKGRSNRSVIQSAIQWHLLMRVWGQFVKNRNYKSGLMLLGAYSVWKGEIDLEGNNYKNNSLEEAYEKYRFIRGDSIHSFLSKEWRLVLYKKNLLYISLWIEIKLYKTHSRLLAWLNQYFND